MKAIISRDDTDPAIIHVTEMDEANEGPANVATFAGPKALALATSFALMAYGDGNVEDRT